MPKRFVDRKDKRDLIKSSGDFRVRRHGFPLIGVVSIFVIVLLATFLLLSWLVQILLFLPDTEAPPDQTIYTLLGSIGACALVAGGFAIYMLFRVGRIVSETEFQSLIFASSMRVNSDFCLVVHKDKKGIYSDYNFSEMFVSEDKEADPFQILLNSSGLDQTNKDKLLNAIENTTSAEISVIVEKEDGGSETLTVSLAPIERPEGFFILRGKRG